jgi:NAD(P)H-flavin reductase
MIITINNKKYDITEFINQHPGGKHVFIDGADMTEEFNKVGHSKEAIKMLEKYLIVDEKEITEVKEEKVKEKEKEFNIDDMSLLDFLYKKIGSSNIFKKLFTHEDYLNMHKIFGSLALVNVLYSIFDLYYSGCNGVFTIRQFGLEFFIFLLIHLLLSLSSLQFHVPMNVNYTTISIGEEYRLHSITFVIRHILVILLLYFFDKNIYSQILIPIIVLFNMYVADLISFYYKPVDEKLGFKIGSLPFWSNCSSELQNVITSIYTLAQIYATFMLISLNSNIEINLVAIFIIQVTAFMGTLSKKGIINNFQWHFIYLFQYALFGYLFFNNEVVVSFKNIIIVLILWCLRTKISMNKFFLWSFVSIVLLFTKYVKSNIPLVVCLSILTFIFNHFGMCFDKKRETSHNIIKTNIHIPNTKLHVIDIKMKNPVEYKPGQYFNLYIDKEKRPYTPIDYDASNNSIQFFIKDYENNKLSEKICAFKNDMCIHVDGSFGNNYYDKDSDLLIFNHKEISSKHILMFYCGTGITPFYSILNNIKSNTKYKFKLFGSLNNESENYLKFKNIKQKIFYSSNKLTPKKVNKILSKYCSDNTTILLCGSEGYNNMIINAINNKFTICIW